MAGSRSLGARFRGPLPLLRSDWTLVRGSCIMRRAEVPREDADYPSRTERPCDSADFFLLEKAAGRPDRSCALTRNHRSLSRSHDAEASEPIASGTPQDLAQSLRRPLAPGEPARSVDEFCARRTGGAGPA